MEPLPSLNRPVEIALGHTLLVVSLFSWSILKIVQRLQLHLQVATDRKGADKAGNKEVPDQTRTQYIEYLTIGLDLRRDIPSIRYSLRVPFPDRIRVAQLHQRLWRFLRHHLLLEPLAFSSTPEETCFHLLTGPLPLLPIPSCSPLSFLQLLQLNGL